MPQGTHSRHGDGVALREEEHASRWTLSATLGPVDVMLAQLQVRLVGEGKLLTIYHTSCQPVQLPRSEAVKCNVVTLIPVINSTSQFLSTSGGLASNYLSGSTSAATIKPELW